MKNLPLMFCGLFFALATSWCGLILSANLQYGALQPVATDEGGPIYPQPIAGVAQQGRQVYIDLGCIYCHTQQVRPAGVGGDLARGWAKRGTVPRDYILQNPVLLGSSRMGPDLADIGDRMDTHTNYLHLYDAQLVAPGSTQPPYRFLFVTQKIGDTPTPHALKFPEGSTETPPAGYEVVPTDRAIALIAYLHSLKIDYELPEAPFAPGTGNATVSGNATAHP
jgi:cytochrome c oxidase cbb3-type subunit 2